MRTLPRRARGIALLALALLGILARADGVEARQEGGSMELANDRVRLRVEPQRDRLLRRFHARGPEGWQLIVESFAPGAPDAPALDSPPPVALYDTTAAPHRHLVGGVAESGQVLPGATADEAAIELCSHTNGVRVVEILRLRRADAHFHVEVQAEWTDGPPRLDYLLSAYTFNLDHPPAFVHTPGQKFDDPRSGPGRDQVIGDRAFHAPAVILQEGGLFAALVPDLAAINRLAVLSPDARRTMRIPRNRFSIPEEPDKTTMPTALDLNVRSGWTQRPVFAFGLMDAVIGHHVRFQHPPGESMVRTLAAPRAGHAFDLLLAADAPTNTGFQRVARHQWERFGQPTFVARPHLAMPFAEYERLVAHVTFKPTPGSQEAPLAGYEDHGSWLEWDLDGTPVGGYRSPIPWWNDVLHNSVFWNNARDAVGMHFWGTRGNDPKLVDRARRIINLCLAAPRNARGLFATLYNANTRQWGLGFTDPPQGRNQLFLRDARSYDVTAMSKTGAHLLDYHLRAEADPRIPAYLAPYADWLLTALDERGTVPSFVTEATEPSPILRDSAQPAASLWFLAEMANASGQAKYCDGAVRIGAYLEHEILPEAKWLDLEQYFSCGAKPLSRVRDDWQHQYFRGNLSVIWAADGFAALHRATRDTRWLRAGETCVDYLSFSQCCWEPHFVYTAFPFGGFAADNSDTTAMLDARQAETVRPFLWCGLQLGRQDLLERGVAAARSSVVLINHPRHQANNIYRHPNLYPLGLGPENIDHEGHPQSAMRTHAGWGEGSGVYTGLAEALRALGGAHVDFERKLAVGADGVTITRFARDSARLEIEWDNHLARLPQPWTAPYPLDLRITGLPPGRYELKLNRDPPREFDHVGVTVLNVTVE